jgi:long-chain acyl-CoA synthetase
MTRHPWERSYPPDVSWSDPLPPPERVERFLERAAERWPERPAIDFYGWTADFRTLRDLAARAACGLQKLGVGPDVQVGLHLPNTPHYVIGFFGVLMAGGRVVNFNPSAPAAEIEQQRADADERVMVTLDSASAYPQIAALTPSGPLHNVVVCGLTDFLPEPLARSLAGLPAARAADREGEVDFAALIANDGTFARPPSAPPDEEVAVLQYTGGTTGEPKGAMLTHANLWAAVAARDRWRGRDAGEGRDRMLAVLPLCHIFGLSFLMLLSLATGAEMVLHLRFDAGRVLADIARKKITIFSGVSTMYTALVNHPDIAACDLSSLERCTAGGGAVPVEVLERFKALTGLTPQEGYGLTETAPLGTLQPAKGPPRPGTVGLPAPQTIVDILDLDTGMTRLPMGAWGEICIQGPQVMKGYWKKPEATAAALRGGRFHTGDVGFIDSDGYVTLVGRKEDMIRTRGGSIFPRRVEEAIYRHPAVAEAMVVGIPGGEESEIATAFVALKPGSPPVTLDALTAFLEGKLAPQEMPAALEIRAALPKTAIGKLSKKDLLAAEAAKRGA